MWFWFWVKLYYYDCLSIAGSGAAAPGALGTPLGIGTGGGDLQGNSLEHPWKLFWGGAAAPGALVPPPRGINETPRGVTGATNARRDKRSKA